MARPCPQCGSSNADTATFCAQCGASLSAVPRQAATNAAPPAGGDGAARVPVKTVLGFATAPVPPGVAPPPMDAQVAAVPVVPIATTAAPQPAESSAARPMGTMLGMPAAPLGLAPPPAPAPAPAQPPPAGRGGDIRTMMGVAMPGIAPIHAGDSTAPPPNPRGEHGTMMGVAAPGIAPLHAGVAPAAPATKRPRPQAALPPIVPAPAPLEQEEEIAAPARRKASGAPIAVVAGGVAVLALASGITIALLWKSAPPLLVQPRVGPAGNEQLHLVCDNCKDGTTASIGASKATFANKEASLDLATPLEVGDNPIAIVLDRPGVGRDETVKAVVPVPYRLRADLSQIGAEPPVILVRVDATAGTTVRIDGKPLTLDGSGHGVHSIDITGDTDGPSDEGKVIEKVIPYEAVPKGGKAESGSVTARVGVIPLRVDAPSSRAVSTKDHVFVAGRTSKGGAVTLNGKPTTIAANGSFAESIELKPGENAVEVRATAAQVAPRTVHLTLRRVNGLDAEAQAVEAASPLGYDAFAADPAANAGKAVIVEGDVVEARLQNHQAVAVVNDRRGCSRPTCILRLVGGEDLDLHAGDAIRGYGRVTRAVSADGGKLVPEVEADFAVHTRVKRP